MDSALIGVLVVTALMTASIYTMNKIAVGYI